MRERLVSLYRKFRNWMQGVDAHERTLTLLGAMFAHQISTKRNISSLHEVEFRVFSQWGDDGIIQWLLARMPELPKTFIEFGVEDYSESTTRFLTLNNNWRGLVMDGSPEKIARLGGQKWFWRHDLTATSHFLTRDNINKIIEEWADEEKLGLLHIDVDGNDFWLWDAIQCITPSIVIVEYNALFGSERAITVPYVENFQRHTAHYSGQYAGASLAAITWLGQKKGYALIGTNSAGNNAYYVHVSELTEEVRSVAVDIAFVKSNFRDSRDRRGRMTYLSFEERQSLIRGLPMFNVLTGELEPF
ncbi:hypothetical protein [Immundisolibacter sp.]|uniref:hypothetical protein n=1 Tax=Immundisolibacter sp. TaxID=1934948 RepID=UPI003563E5D3